MVDHAAVLLESALLENPEQPSIKQVKNKESRDSWSHKIVGFESYQVNVGETKGMAQNIWTEPSG